MKMPTLYKVDSKNKIRQWQCIVDHFDDYSIINVFHGQKEGKLQNKQTIITKGKNLNKKNKTDHKQQAEKNAKSIWLKQKDKQYTENIQEQIKDGKEFRPMLAHKFSEQSHKIKFPCYVSAKSDGSRAYLGIESGIIYAKTRNGKNYKVLDHIIISLNTFFSTNPSIILDGELYVHGESFQEIIGAIKRDKPNDLTNQIEFHIYDCFDVNNPTWKFKDRLDFIRKIQADKIKLVDSYEVNSEEEITQWKDKFISDGYEGLMIRNNSPYEQKRSYNLQKVKDFDDAEFKIIGIEKDKNDEAVFLCESEHGNFSCKPKGDREYRKSLLDEKYIGRLMKVEYFGLTDKKIPRFPIGLTIFENKDEVH